MYKYSAIGMLVVTVLIKEVGKITRDMLSNASLTLTSDFIARKIKARVSLVVAGSI